MIAAATAIAANRYFLVPSALSTGSGRTRNAPAPLVITGFVKHAVSTVGEIYDTGLGCLDGVPSPTVVEADIGVFEPLQAVL